uniref:Uncharacterized protein n=1 Tax=Oncorhynchus kisutch TaxID=8019 RepID=A0A8C7HVQ6_ONCKI
MAGFGHGPKLECWEPEDNPWSEHIKRSPNCGFLAIRNNVGELTVAEFYHLEQERLHIYIRKTLYLKMLTLRSVFFFLICKYFDVN